MGIEFTSVAVKVRRGAYIAYMSGFPRKRTGNHRFFSHNRSNNQSKVRYFMINMKLDRNDVIMFLLDFAESELL